jgi:uncharacterized protein YneF (UPF0154 family)
MKHEKQTSKALKMLCCWLISMIVVYVPVFSQENPTSTIRNTLIFIPLTQLDENTNFAYLSELIVESIRTALLDDALFNLISIEDAKQICTKLEITHESLLVDETMIGLYAHTGANLVLYGTYSIDEAESILTMDLSIYSVALSKIVATEQFTSPLLKDMYLAIDESVTEFRSIIMQKYTPVEGQLVAEEEAKREELEQRAAAYEEQYQDRMQSAREQSEYQASNPLLHRHKERFGAHIFGGIYGIATSSLEISFAIGIMSSEGAIALPPLLIGLASFAIDIGMFIERRKIRKLWESETPLNPKHLRLPWLLIGGWGFILQGSTLAILGTTMMFQAIADGGWLSGLVGLIGLGIAGYGLVGKVLPGVLLLIFRSRLQDRLQPFVQPKFSVSVIPIKDGAAGIISWRF